MQRKGGGADPVGLSLERLEQIRSGPLDFLAGEGLEEKLVELMLAGVPGGPSQVMKGLSDLARTIDQLDTRTAQVVVFGGGTGLANVVGGDSRSPAWVKEPFAGIKELFPNTTSIVCTTDDGGSTGELRRDLPLIGLGDLRHVLLSSIRRAGLVQRYQVGDHEAAAIAATLHGLFNLRFTAPPASLAALLDGGGVQLDELPAGLRQGLQAGLKFVFGHPLLKNQLARPHCLGNLILAGAVYQQLTARGGGTPSHRDYLAGLGSLSELFGNDPRTVLPCTTTPATLKVLYTNGVMVSGEYKSGDARRGSPMDRLFVEFCRPVELDPEVREAIGQADILLFAPGSLYTSLIPVLQVPGMADAIRANQRAMKVLVANLWVQKGETDLVREAPQRHFNTSDLIRAYHRNIPGGIGGLFEQVLAMKMQDIPGSILQSYDFEGKIPIYFDRARVGDLGVSPVEATTFSREALEERRVLQHGPAAVATVVKTLWAAKSAGQRQVAPHGGTCFAMERQVINPKGETPDRRMATLAARLDELGVAEPLRRELLAILWRHQDIPVSHFDCVQGLEVVASKAWSRSQEWDKIFSFYDPFDATIKIRHDVLERPNRLEIAFLVALGQSLLGNYVARRQMAEVARHGENIGKTYEIELRPLAERNCFFDAAELDQFLRLARMVPCPAGSGRYTRLVNGGEGFTPPGVLMGLTYAWYLDNRLAAHVEYKMAILRTPLSGLIPEQVKVFGRRKNIIDFFRKTVFRHRHAVYEEEPETGDGPVTGTPRS